MRRILLVLTVAAVMAAMMMASALPAFAVGDSGGIKGRGFRRSLRVIRELPTIVAQPSKRCYWRRG